MSLELALILMIALPFASAFVAAAFDGAPDARDAAVGLFAIGTFALALMTAGEIWDGRAPALTIASIAPGLPIALRAEPLGAAFAVISSGLWLVTHVYSIGYMRETEDLQQTRFFAFVSLAVAATMGVALSANLFTLFIFYECLTFATYPLVVHYGDEASRRAGAVYIGILLPASFAGLFAASVWTYTIAGRTDFEAGGLLTGMIDANLAGLLLVLFVFGCAKSAIIPMHLWLPRAMVAPTPVSALLHAVCVVSAGVFAILKICLFILGPEAVATAVTREAMTWIAAASVTIASILALTRDDIKARLAYSTISQLSLVILGALLMTPTGVLGASLQMFAHAMAKITLFFAAGLIATSTGRTRVSEYAGVSTEAPVAFWCFVIGAASLVGLPPFAGAWPKLMLLNGAAEAGRPMLAALLGASSVLTAIYLFEPVIKGLRPGSGPVASRTSAASFGAMAPVITALGTIGLFVFSAALAAFLKPSLL
ncbi:MAG: proton-conducting transporter membrane subunit [Caulobacterales bacterium]